MKMNLTLSNSTSLPRRFQLEPWGGIYSIPERGAVRVEIDSPSTPVMELEVQDDIILVIVQGPAGADAFVYDGEHRVKAR